MLLKPITENLLIHTYTHTCVSMWLSMCWREGSYLLGDGGGVSCDGVGDFDGCVPKTFSHDPVLPAAAHTYTQAQRYTTVKASHMQKCSMCQKKPHMIWSVKHPPLIAKPSSILAHMCVCKPACIPTNTHTYTRTSSSLWSGSEVDSVYDPVRQFSSNPLVCL